MSNPTRWVLSLAAAALLAAVAVATCFSPHQDCQRSYAATEKERRAAEGYDPASHCSHESMRDH